MHICHELRRVHHKVEAPLWHMLNNIHIHPLHTDHFHNNVVGEDIGSLELNGTSMRQRVVDLTKCTK